jgi:hypothetical protein
MSSPVFLSAFGSFYDEGDFVAVISRVPWKDPDDVQVFVSEEGHDGFRQIYGMPCVEPD